MPIRPPSKATIPSTSPPLVLDIIPAMIPEIPDSTREEELDAISTGERRFRDPVHQYIPISARVCEFIDTEHFQRLKKIKQLGTSYFVWPGASHNRFEHCLGVAHLSRRMARHLQQSQPSLHITDRDVECVEIAGLCHDLGHGPWSHVWDGMFIPRAMPGTNWRHEDASEMMFDDLIQENDIVISPEDAAFIKALIAGDPSKCGLHEKRFLFDIVANKRNGIDVDKLDYIARDKYHIGDKDNMSFERLIHSARVIENQICWDSKEAGHVYNICFSRFMLHKQYYSHKTARAIEYMIVDALLAADARMKISERIYNPRLFLYLNDSIMDRIQESSDPELASSRAIFRRIATRDLYRQVDYNLFGWELYSMLKESVTPELIVERCRALGAPDTLTPEHVIVDMGTLHYGMQDRNPLETVKFYSKRHPNVCHGVDDVQFMTTMPAVFGEVCLRVFTRDSRYFGIIQAGFRALLKSLPGFHPQPAPGIANAPAELRQLTPPATEGTSTPRTTSLASLASEVPASATAPAAAGPSTPRAKVSELPGSAGAVREGSQSARTTPFGINPLTTVAPNYAPASPTHENRRLRSAKRGRVDEEDAPPSKRKAS